MFDGLMRSIANSWKSTNGQASYSHAGVEIGKNKGLVEIKIPDLVQIWDKGITLVWHK